MCVVILVPHPGCVAGGDKTLILRAMCWSPPSISPAPQSVNVKKGAPSGVVSKGEGEREGGEGTEKGEGEGERGGEREVERGGCVGG